MILQTKLYPDMPFEVLFGHLADRSLVKYVRAIVRKTAKRKEELSMLSISYVSSGGCHSVHLIV